MSRINVLGVGATSPLGLDSRQTAFAMRARKLVPSPSDLLEVRGSRVGTARTLGLPDSTVGVERMIEIGARALREAARDAGVLPDEPIRVFLTLADTARPFDTNDAAQIVAKSFLPKLERRSGQRIDGANSEVLRLGHAGFAVVLERAIAALGGGTPIAVGGIDSYHHVAILEWLDRELRLLGDEVENGFVPSEGGAFLIIGAAKGDHKPIARIVHATAGIDRPEEDDKGGPPVRTALVMTEMVRRAATVTGSSPFPWVLTDLNGERHRSREWSFVTIRNPDIFKLGFTREQHVGQLVGDAGAATGALAATMAVVAFRTGFAPASEALLALHSDGDERGVVVLEGVS